MATKSLFEQRHFSGIYPLRRVSHVYVRQDSEERLHLDVKAFFSSAAGASSDVVTSPFKREKASARDQLDALVERFEQESLDAAEEYGALALVVPSDEVQGACLGLIEREGVRIKEDSQFQTCTGVPIGSKLQFGMRCK